MKFLLVEPDFPVPRKSKNHSSFLPIGLLKIGSYLRRSGHGVKLVRGDLHRSDLRFVPDRILVTSLFTYWSNHVRKSVQHYRNQFPCAPVEVGGVFASLMPEQCKAITGCDLVTSGLYDDGKAENVPVDYSLLPGQIDYQIVHATRGCKRRCSFCGAWRIEARFKYKTTIESEIQSNKLVFYDNNLLANPHIEGLLDELSQAKYNGRVVYSECQSGIDGRILLDNPQMAWMLKAARFVNPRIAWDTALSDHKVVKEQIDLLKAAGYTAARNDADIFVFILYNHLHSYGEVIRKLEYCRRWGVLVIDCRFRPLDLLVDGYRPRVKTQEDHEYFLSPGWTDHQVRTFRRKVRRQNVAIRLGLPGNRYVEGVEKGFVHIN